MTDPRAILAFMTAGKATVTFRSAESGTRFTYKVKLAPKRQDSDPDTWFVMLLTGPDNSNDYQYMGIMRKDAQGVLQYIWTSKSRIGKDAPSVKGFVWALSQFVVDACPAKLEVYHEGRCGRCGRKLTVPESVDTGFGPECINLVGFGAVSRIVAAGEAVEQQQKFSYVPPAASEPLAAMAARAAGSPFDFVSAEAAKQAAFDRAERVGDMDAEIRRRVEEYKRESPENYYQDGELQEDEAFKVAYNKFRVDLVFG
jgi:hypothetical protein